MCENVLVMLRVKRYHTRQQCMMYGACESFSTCEEKNDEKIPREENNR